jgi:phosphohistidine phosphatase
MDLYLLRHGIAEEGGTGMNDADRALTAEGRRKLRQVLMAACDAKVSLDLIVSSPLKRALQTAEVARKTLRYKGAIIKTKALEPGASVQQVWDEIRDYRDKAYVMLVGHNPLFSYLAAYLLGSTGMQVDFKKGGLMKISFEHFPPAPRGMLCWYITPKAVSKLRK